MVYDVAIIGAGPGGYVSALKAAQNGLKVAIIEKNYIGGVCLNCGCIPTKTILASIDKYNEALKLKKFGINLENIELDYKKVFERKEQVVLKLRKSLEQLVKSYKIDIYYGEASIESAEKLVVDFNEEKQYILFKNLIIATGSRPVSLPGLQIDHNFIIDTNDVLAMQDFPDNILIVGSGASGIEWARIFSSIGKKVKLLEIADNIAPMFDSSISERVERLLKRKKVEIYTSTKIKNIINSTVYLENDKEFVVDKIFAAAGRVPNLDIKGIEDLQLAMNGKFIEINDSMQTNISNIYAIGDVTGKLQLAHVASHQGIAAVEHILNNKKSKMNYYNVPKIVYGNPELASVGYTEQELQERSIDYEVSNFPVGAVGKSIVDDEIEGFIKVLASKDKIYGVHIVAHNADMLIQQATIAMQSNLVPQALKETVFAHPTVSEALYEAFLGIDGSSLHVPKLN